MTGQPNGADARLIKPCKHMVNAVNGLSDGTLRGLMKIYTKLHVLHCSHCRTALNSLTNLHGRLGALAESDASDGLPEVKLAAMDQALDRLEGKREAGVGNSVDGV